MPRHHQVVEISERRMVQRLGLFTHCSFWSRWSLCANYSAPLVLNKNRTCAQNRTRDHTEQVEKAFGELIASHDGSLQHSSAFSHRHHLFRPLNTAAYVSEERFWRSIGQLLRWNKSGLLLLAFRAHRTLYDCSASLWQPLLRLV